MLRVLVAVASRHGGTDGIARALAAAVQRTFDTSGVEAEVDCTSLVDVPSVERYDAVVLGSAVYMGRWLSTARRFVDAHAAELAVRPTWLFSSGPIGSPQKPTDDAVDVAHLVDITRARAHETFPGRLQRNDLRLAGTGSRPRVARSRGRLPRLRRDRRVGDHDRSHAGRRTDTAKVLRSWDLRQYPQLRHRVTIDSGLTHSMEEGK